MKRTNVPIAVLFCLAVTLRRLLASEPGPTGPTFTNNTGMPFWRAGDVRVARRGPWKLVIEKRKVMLFNLLSDVGERQDLAKQHPERLQELQKQLVEWERDVDAEATE